MRFLTAALSSALLVGGALRAADPPPWDVLGDPTRLARLSRRGTVVLHGSRCPSGCRYDRSADGDTRFLRIEGEEEVVFEETGPGAIVRIWMTQGQGLSEALSPAVRLRVRVDGEETPRVDLALPELFSGTRPPFAPPLVAGRVASSGGNVSYVPIAYRRGCRVSFVGARRERIWFQFTVHRLPTDAAAETFTGAEDLSRLRALLASPGEDPWAAFGGETRTFEATLRGGEARALGALAGPDLLTALHVDAPPAAWDALSLVLTFDGAVRVDARLSDLFAAGRTGAMPTRSLLVGRDGAGSLYAYFPMPFFSRAELAVRHDAAVSALPVTVRLRIRRLGAPPPPDSGLFGVVTTALASSTPPRDARLLSRTGHGLWVGLFAELGSVGTDGVANREYLEGDERVYVDGARDPAHSGTGVEDFFGGGFYFDQGPFARALHGAPYRVSDGLGHDAWGMYRLLLADAVPYRAGIEAGFEGGPTGLQPMSVRATAYVYDRPEPALVRFDRFDVGDAASAAAHAYRVAGTPHCSAASGAFEAAVPEELPFVACVRSAGASRFVFTAAGSGAVRRLRRRFDGAEGAPAAEVFVNGSYAGRFPAEPANPYFRLREVDLDLPLPSALVESRLAVEVRPVASGLDGETPPFSEVAWELWASPPLASETPAGDDPIRPRYPAAAGAPRTRGVGQVERPSGGDR